MGDISNFVNLFRFSRQDAPVPSSGARGKPRRKDRSWKLKGNKTSKGYSPRFNTLRCPTEFSGVKMIRMDGPMKRRTKTGFTPVE